MGWAEIKKSVNSDLNTPLNVTIGKKSDAAGYTDEASLFSWVKEINEKLTVRRYIHAFDIGYSELVGKTTVEYSIAFPSPIFRTSHILGISYSAYGYNGVSVNMPHNTNIPKTQGELMHCTAGTNITGSFGVYGTPNTSSYFTVTLTFYYLAFTAL